MTRVQLIVRVCLLTIAAVALLVPAARDELDWYWTEFQDRAPNYMAYLTDRPNGLHATEARARYEKRQWASAKRELILQAYQQAANTNSAPESDAAYQSERQVRRELLFWRQATNTDTVVSYENYLRQYPQGQFAVKARSQIEKLNQSGRGVESLKSATPP